MKEYRRHYAGVTLVIRADFAQSAWPLEYKLEKKAHVPLWKDDPDWHGTPFQVADASHSHGRAFDLVKNWVGI